MVSNAAVNSLLGDQDSESIDGIDQEATRVPVFNFDPENDGQGIESDEVDRSALKSLNDVLRLP